MNNKNFTDIMFSLRDLANQYLKENGEIDNCSGMPCEDDCGGDCLLDKLFSKTPKKNMASGLFASKNIWKMFKKVVDFLSMQ
jgi:hypothetical protein